MHLLSFGLASATVGVKASIPPRRAAPINLRALPLETSPLASPLARASNVVVESGRAVAHSGEALALLEGLDHPHLRQSPVSGHPDRLVEDDHPYVVAGNDSVFRNFGIFNGGEGNDSVSDNRPPGTFNGGPGNDHVNENNGTFFGEAGDDSVGLNPGIFNGGDGIDTVARGFPPVDGPSGT
jgi:hypothetical protein